MVKAIYPEIRRYLVADLANARRAAQQITKLMDIPVKGTIDSIMDEQVDSFPRELDLRIEARHLRKSRLFFHRHGIASKIAIPVVVDELSSSSAKNRLVKIKKSGVGVGGIVAGPRDRPWRAAACARCSSRWAPPPLAARSRFGLAVGGGGAAVALVADASLGGAPPGAGRLLGVRARRDRYLPSHGGAACAPAGAEASADVARANHDARAPLDHRIRRRRRRAVSAAHVFRGRLRRRLSTRLGARSLWRARRFVAARLASVTQNWRDHHRSARFFFSDVAPATTNTRPTISATTPSAHQILASTIRK